jgi:hypothetical protein
MQSKISKYSGTGASLEKATVFPDWGSEGPIRPDSQNNVQLAKAETTMAEAASTKSGKYSISDHPKPSNHQHQRRSSVLPSTQFDANNHSNTTADAVILCDHTRHIQ